MGRWRSAGLVEGERQEGGDFFLPESRVGRRGCKNRLEKVTGLREGVYRLRGPSPGEPRARVAHKGGFSGLFPYILKKVLCC